MEAKNLSPENKEVLEDVTLYHGSRCKLDDLEPRQARTKEGVEVPEDELSYGIYFTPDYAAALAMAARPYGLNKMDLEGESRTIHFEHPELFQPDMDVYIYSIGSSSIPEGHLKKVDDQQYVVEGLDSLKPESCEVRKAKDIFEYYKQV